MRTKEKAIKYIKSLLEPKGWPGDIPVPFPLTKEFFVSPKEWRRHAREEIVQLKKLTSTQSTVDRDQVLDLVASGAPDIRPLPMVTVMSNGETIIEDGNHRLSAKMFLGHKTAKVELLNINTLPNDVVTDAIDKGRISKKLFKQLMENVIVSELNNILFEQSNEKQYDGPLYHVTYFNRLEGIASAGLRPRMARSIGAASYDAHASKGVFLTEADGVSFWYSRAEAFAEHNSDNPMEDGLVPVVLQIDPAGFTMEELSDDELGSRDAFAGAYIHPTGIEAEHIDVWDGEGWILVEDWQEIDVEQAFDREESEDEYNEDGELEVWHTFKQDSPLEPDI